MFTSFAKADTCCRISIATVISFAARGLSSTGLFCYQAVSSAGVVLILPGYTICELKFASSML
jgi:uncharacterized membrane protein YjjP (DUF1212 family)